MTNTRTRTSLLGAAASAAAEAVADALAAAEARSAAKAAVAPGPAVTSVAVAPPKAAKTGPMLGLLSRESGETLIDQIVRSVAARIDDRLLRGGARMPSIRAFAAAHGVSAFTVVASYDKLVASGHLESRRGAGFFVREPAALEMDLAQRRPGGKRRAGESERERERLGVQPIDVVWLVRNMFRQMPHGQTPGTGVLPPDWLDGAAIANALRSVSRQNANLLVSYGVPQGFLPLRQQLQLKFAELEIAAAPEQIVTTAGVTQALDLVAREFTRPGDTIFVDDPALIWKH